MNNSHAFPSILREIPGGYVINFPDIPELSYKAGSIEEVCKQAKEMLTDYVKNASELPEATPLQSIQITNKEYIIILDVE